MGFLNKYTQTQAASNINFLKNKINKVLFKKCYSTLFSYLYAQNQTACIFSILTPIIHITQNTFPNTY